jgi:kinesin family protein C1
MEKELRSRAEDNSLEEKNERVAVSAQMMAMTTEHAAKNNRMEQEHSTLKIEHAHKLEEAYARLEEETTKLKEAGESNRGLEVEKAALKEAMSSQKSATDQEAAETISTLKGEVELLKEKLKNSEMRTAAFGDKSANDVQELEDQLAKMKLERRKMFNVIQELRGNVRVFARVRPFLPSDGAAADAVSVVSPLDEFRLTVKKDGADSNGTEHKFSFDKVFSPSIGQEQIFTEVSEFVQSALDGFNVCLFSYGQTGSGKTPTMQGSGTGQMRGIIPRAIQQVGAYKAELEKDGWEYSMSVSFLEIYNETIRDLLREEKAQENKHELKVDANGRRYVSDLTMCPLDPNSEKEVEDVMRQSAKHRSVACTDMNAVSSRSHSVFTLHLTATHQGLNQCLQGKLNLVDLAGQREARPQRPPPE